MNANLTENQVRITHNQPQYARTRNGAWIGNGASETVRVVTLEEARNYHTGSGTYTLEYADGLVEVLDCDNTPCRFSAYGPNAPTEGKVSRALGTIGYYAWERR